MERYLESFMKKHKSGEWKTNFSFYSFLCVGYKEIFYFQGLEARSCQIFYFQNSENCSCQKISEFLVLFFTKAKMSGTRRGFSFSALELENKWYT